MRLEAISSSNKKLLLVCKKKWCDVHGDVFHSWISDEATQKHVKENASLCTWS